MMSQQQTVGTTATTWREFVDEHWERTPLSTNPPFFDFPVTAEELFEIACGVPTVSAGPSAPEFRFYRDGANIACDLHRFSPRPENGDWQGLADRRERELGGDPYTLVFTQVQAMPTTLWERARDFLAPLFSELGGVPSRFVELVVFFGRYPSTPFV